MKKILGGIAAKKLTAGIAAVAVIATIGAGTAIYKHKQNLEQDKIRIEANLTNEIKKDKSKEESTYSGSTSNSTVKISKIRPSSSTETKQPSQPTNPSQPSNSSLKTSESEENIELEQKLLNHKSRLRESDSYRACIYAELDNIFDSMVSGELSASQATNKMLQLNLNCDDSLHTNIHCVEGSAEARIEKTTLNSDCTELRDLMADGEYSNFKIFYDSSTHTNIIYSMGTSIDSK